MGEAACSVLEQVLQDPVTVLQKLTLDWCGEGERTLEICTGTALWYRYGYDPLPTRRVLTRDPRMAQGLHPDGYIPVGRLLLSWKCTESGSDPPCKNFAGSIVLML
jgi:hypothetical protein